MDHTNSKQVRLVEEEKFGWTILTTVQDGDGELDMSKDPLRGNSLPLDDDGEPHIGLMEEDMYQHEQQFVVGDEHKVKKSRKEGNDEYEEEEKDEVVELDDVKFVTCSGEDAKLYPKRAFMWVQELWEEAACAEFVVAKQTLVQQPAQKKRGLVWRFSLVATLGFLGWVVISGLIGGVKDLQCLKLHPCSIKEGDPVLTTL